MVPQETQDQIVTSDEQQLAPAQEQHALQMGQDQNIEFQKEGKFGDFGSYKTMADLRPAGEVVASASGSIEKKAIFGFINVKGSLVADVEADLVGGVLSLAQKSNKAWIQKIASFLAARAGR